MQIINLIIALINLALKYSSIRELKQKELKDEINEAVSSHDLSRINGIINKLRK